MATFILIAKTVLCSIVSAAAVAAITAKINTMISPPHAHLGEGMVVMLFVGYAVVTAFVCSIIAALVLRNSLDVNWLKIAIGAAIVGEIVVLGFIIYGAINR